MLSSNNAIGFKCNTGNVRNVIVHSMINNGSENIMEWLSINEGYSSKKDIFYSPDDDLNLVFDDRVNTFSTIHEYENKDYLINFIHFPEFILWLHEHELYSVDTCLLVLDSTDSDVIRMNERMIRILIKNRIKPIIFIDRLDLLMDEFGENLEGLVRRFAYLMNNVNEIVENELGSDEWNLEIAKGNVLFGSTVYGWAFNRQISNKTGIEFTDISYAHENDTSADLKDKLSVSWTICDSIIANSPSASDSLEYKLPLMCKNEISNDIVQSIIEGDSDGPLRVMFVSKIDVKNGSPEIYCRVLSGTLKKGDEIHLIGSDEKIKVTNTFIFRGPFQLAVDEIPSGKMGTVFLDNVIYFGEIYII